jgi:hypothetical protein
MVRHHIRAVSGGARLRAALPARPGVRRVAAPESGGYP